SLHLLIAISRSPETLAHALLTTCAVPLSSLRNTVLSWYTSGRIPRQYVQKQAPLEPAVIDRGPAPPARKATAQPPPHAPPPRDAVAEHGEKAAPFLFDPLAYPNLSALTTNLTEAAAKGKFDPLIGREREVEAAVDVLGKRRGNNPVLVGPPGVGKTAIVEGIAQRLLEMGDDRVILELETSQLVAGTSLRGAFAERLEAIKDEMRKAAGRI